jgi:hypothetical protein
MLVCDFSLRELKAMMLLEEALAGPCHVVCTSSWSNLHAPLGDIPFRHESSPDMQDCGWSSSRLANLNDNYYIHPFTEH